MTRYVEKLKEHFRGYDPVPTTGFHVAGYEADSNGLKPRLFRVIPSKNQSTLLNPPRNDGQPSYGASWDGESDILVRLIQPVFLRDKNGNYSALPHYAIPWAFFNLQDAIDFAVYAIRATIESVRFQPRAKTVGGPIDVLVIKPSESKWISRKELKVV